MEFAAVGAILLAAYGKRLMALQSGLGATAQRDDTSYSAIGGFAEVAHLAPDPNANRFDGARQPRVMEGPGDFGLPKRYFRTGGNWIVPTYGSIYDKF